MRILLATAAALAPLMAAAGASAAGVISTSRTTVIRTSNATGSAPDNIRLASGGAINVASGSAITLDSNHSVDLDSGSSITMTRAASGATAIEARPGLNSGIIVGGTIRITDDIDTPVDTDRDGDADGPFASGDNRYGVRIVGPGTFTGDILVENTGSIVVEGNNSAGILVEPGLAGRIDTRGTISVVGNNTFGVRTQGNVQGVRIGSGVSALGDGAVGVAVDGNVSGQVRLQGAVSATGYRFTSRLVKAGGAQARPELLYYEDLDADDTLQGGPAVRVTGDIGSGILLDIAPRYLGGLEGDDDGDSVKNGDEDDDGDGTINRNDSDRDGDGVPDAQETDSSLTVFGGAPALMIGSDTRASTIGAVGTGDNAFGVINHGTITSQGLLDGVTSTGIQLGAGQAVAIAGGFRNSGTISATAYDADARAVAIGAGVSAPAIVNSGTLQASGLTELVKRAFGLDIAAGSTVSSLVNSGAIGANLAGEKGDAIGLRDASGTLTSIINTGRIFGVVTATDDEDDNDDRNTDASDEVVTGRAIAIDVSANTTGVTLVQTGDTTVDRFSDFDSDGTPDLTDTDDDNDGIPDAQDNADNDDDNDGVPDEREAIISGAVLFGSGADTFDVPVASWPTALSTVSATPPASTPTTGRPHAMASSTIRPKGSLSLACTKASQPAIIRATAFGSRS